MVHSTSEDRAVHLTREAVELIDAGHREVGLDFSFATDPAGLLSARGFCFVRR